MINYCYCFKKNNLYIIEKHPEAFRDKMVILWICFKIIQERGSRWRIRRNKIGYQLMTF